MTLCIEAYAGRKGWVLEYVHEDEGNRIKRAWCCPNQELRRRRWGDVMVYVAGDPRPFPGGLNDLRPWQS